jgi:Mce-associated membrane protein
MADDADAAIALRDSPTDLDDAITADGAQAGSVEHPETDADHPDDSATGETEIAATGAGTRKWPRLARVRLPRKPISVALCVGLAMLLAVGALVGWLGYRVQQSLQQDQERALFIQVGRQGAVNLTTIDFNQADADVKRILDSATGSFYDDFSQRSGPFIDVVKQTQSKTEGAVTEAGLEAMNGDTGEVLVAISVKTTNAGTPEPQMRSWRMRLAVHKDDRGVKVSNVEFVA